MIDDRLDTIYVWLGVISIVLIIVIVVLIENRIDNEVSHSTEFKCAIGYKIDYTTSEFIVCKNYGTNQIYISARKEFMDEWCGGRK